MSRFDLRDISQRLTNSRDVEAVVSEFLGYLHAVRSDWQASLAFYEVSRDALVQIYTRNGPRLVRRDVNLPVEMLPSRLVRKFFHPSAFFNSPDRRTLLSHMFQNAPTYEPDPSEAPALASISPMASWQSCICMPLADREDLLAVLTIASDKRGAFPGKVVGELIPLKSLAALSLAQHLHKSTSRTRPTDDVRQAQTATAMFQERIRRLNAETASLVQDNKAKADKLASLSQEIEQLDKSSGAYRRELDKVKHKLVALEEQSTQAAQHLTDAYAQLTATQSRTDRVERTVSFLKDVFQVMSQQHDPSEFANTMVSWFGEQFGVDRCSLMVLDDSNEALRVHTQRGLDPSLAPRIKVRVGQGIAGWVAHNRKPLFVRMKRDAKDVQHTHQDAYNSDSFISVPMVHSGHLVGVLNLSNKRGGEAFDEHDLDRAVLAGAVLATSLGGSELARTQAAWA
ncbi:MAG: GAF domain-containing protein [Candidatus Eisenbacteria bacterium]|uniref:GAF domain-containing protein n=1 Tax=Eiseniibacteriota bacterium TaxID=2212470 RepID=A0A849SEA3_UNCEI|nr:GAF domain-containing protein [Candidatus Eisenbacteria bacterium]